MMAFVGFGHTDDRATAYAGGMCGYCGYCVECLPACRVPARAHAVRCGVCDTRELWRGAAGLCARVQG